MPRRPSSHGLVLLLAGLLGNSLGASELKVYAYLSPEFLGPVLAAFEHETKIPVRAEYMTASQLLERLQDERAGSSADVIFTMEAKRLAKLVAADVLSPVTSKRLEGAIPSYFRHPDNLWFGLSKWSRTVYYARDRVDPAQLQRYADLADPRWKGRICVRPSNKIYVQSLLASIIAHDGEAAARRFVRGIVANLARSPVDLDTVQLEGIAAGVCDLAIANSYYYARIVPLQASPLQGNPAEQPRHLIAAVAPLALEQAGRGVHMNISAFALTKASRQPELARRLMEYMAQPLAQMLYARGSKDFPVLAGLRTDADRQVFGSFKEDMLPIAALAPHYRLAEQISRGEGWLWK